MSITLDGTNGITTPDLESSGPVTGTTGTFSGAVQASSVATNLYPLVSATAQASTSGTSIDFTGIPSWAKRITVLFNGVSQSGSSNILVQLGDSGGIETTSYAASSVMAVAASATEGTTFTTGFGLWTGANSWTFHGTMTIALVNSSTNLWVSSHTFGRADAARVINGGGSKALSDTLTQIRITTATADTFDAGSINIMYE